MVRFIGKYGWRKVAIVLPVVLVPVALLSSVLFNCRLYTIPTGAMAPTILGRNKSLVCPQCGTSFCVSASMETGDQGDDDVAWRRRFEVVEATCPNCRLAMNTDPETPEGRNWLSRGGDHIFVTSHASLSEPNRWDVVVFRYPLDQRMNFIKRLVGMPNETVRISRGDIYAKPDGGEHFEIVRKPAEKVLAMAQAVYDNDYIAPALSEAGWPLRWQPVGSDGAAAWESPDGGRAYETAGGEGEAWIRYQHFIASANDWRRIQRDGTAPEAPLPHLITDFYGYNTSQTPGSPDSVPLGLHWVGDLLLDLTLTVNKEHGSVVLDLVKEGRHFACRLDVQTGEAALTIAGLPDFAPTAQTIVRGTGRHQLMFANVDRQLLLWVDGQPASFSAPTSYDDLDNALPTADDLAPAGVASRGADVKVEHLVLKRDIYYIARKAGADFGGEMFDYDLPTPWPPERYASFFSSPDRWTADSLFSSRRSVEFALAADQFFTLGDNSPRSKDSRLWANGGAEYYVPRKLLLGRALYVYLPEFRPIE